MLRFSEQLERATYRDRDGAWSDRVLRLVQQECDLERTPPRRHEARQDVVQNRLEEIAEPRERELPLRLGRPAGENARPSVTGDLDTSQPECRLPDPGFAYERERARPVEITIVEECLEALQLLLPDLVRHGRNHGCGSPLRQECSWTRETSSQRSSAIVGGPASAPGARTRSTSTVLVHESGVTLPGETVIGARGAPSTRTKSAINRRPRGPIGLDRP